VVSPVVDPERLDACQPTGGPMGRR
jgi:hypothetical protein